MIKTSDADVSLPADVQGRWRYVIRAGRLLSHIMLCMEIQVKEY